MNIIIAPMFSPDQNVLTCLLEAQVRERTELYERSSPYKSVKTRTQRRGNVYIISVNLLTTGIPT